MQKPAGQQEDERVDERVDNRMTSAVPANMHALKDNLNPEAFKKTVSGKHTQKKKGSRSNSNKKHKSGQKQNVTQQLLPSSIPFMVPSLLSQLHTANANSIVPASVVPIPIGFTNQGQTFQFGGIPAEHMPPFTYSEFVTGGGFQRALVVIARKEEGGDVARETLPDHKVRMMLIVWMLLVFIFSKIRESQWDNIIFQKVLDQI